MIEQFTKKEWFVIMAYAFVATAVIVGLVVLGVVAFKLDVVSSVIATAVLIGVFIGLCLLFSWMAYSFKEDSDASK